MSIRKNYQHIIVALEGEYSEVMAQAMTLATTEIKCVKVKPETFFTSYGKDVVAKLKQMGFTVFMDAKLCDTHHVMDERSTYPSPPDMLNMMASAGTSSMKVFSEACSAQGIMSIAVTVFTTMDEDESRDTFDSDMSVEQQVLHFAKRAAESGIVGLVCSAKELPMIKKDEVTRDMITIVPGIRLPEDSAAGQKRIVTPHEAFNLGADYLVVGSPITGGGPEEILARAQKWIDALPWR